MAGKRRVTTRRGDFTFVWENGPRGHGTVNVIARKKGAREPVMEWVYPRLHNSLLASVSILGEQSLVQAQHEAAAQDAAKEPKP